MRYMDQDPQRCLAKARSELASMTPGECYAVANLCRETKPYLSTKRLREHADELAEEFEQRAITRIRQSYLS